MDALEKSERIETATLARVTAIYAKALNTALEKKASFLRKIQAVDDGRIKPPKYYVDRDMVDVWREGFVRELIRQENVIDDIIDELNRAGVEAADVIKSGLRDVYEVNRTEAAQEIAEAAHGAGVDVSFAQYNKRQIQALMQKEESPFSKLAYENLGKNPVIRRRLQSEMAQAVILGESQKKIEKRIRKVTGQSVAQARRVAQTERTRVQSQARYMAGQEAENQGVRIYNKWICKMMPTSRDPHIERHEKCALHGQYFPGSNMRFPGDPGGGASEVCNCHCVMIQHVLLPGEQIIDGHLVKG